jgi:hypothetical protein
VSREDLLSLIDEQRRYHAGEIAQEEMSDRLKASLELGYPNWTTSEDGRENSSYEFTKLMIAVERLLLEGCGRALDPAWVSAKAGLIMAQLAHVHHLAPVPPAALGKTTPPLATAGSECGIDTLQPGIVIPANEAGSERATETAAS